MNISEANAWYAVLEGLRTPSSTVEQERALDAVEFLTQRASDTLGAGRRPAQAKVLVGDVMAAVQLAIDHPVFPQIVDWSARRPIDTTHAVGGVL